MYRLINTFYLNNVTGLFDLYKHNCLHWSKFYIYELPGKRCTCAKRALSITQYFSLRTLEKERSILLLLFCVASEWCTEEMVDTKYFVILVSSHGNTSNYFAWGKCSLKQRASTCLPQYFVGLNFIRKAEAINAIVV